MKYFTFKFLLVLLTLAMAIPPAWADETLLVCNGTETNGYVPITYAGAYPSYPQHQMIYPADLLSDMSGTEITGITFYTSSAIVMNQGSFDVKLGETTQSTYSSATAITGLTTVASGQVPVAGGTELVINFDNGYTYNGGNLVVEIYLNSKLYSSLLVSAKTFFAAEKIRLNPVVEVQPFSLPLFLLQNTSNDEQRYTFYRTAGVWSAD